MYPQDFATVGYVADVVVAAAVSPTALWPLPGIFINLLTVPHALRRRVWLILQLQVVAAAVQLLSPVDSLALGITGGFAAVRRQRLMDHIAAVA